MQNWEPGTQNWLNIASSKEKYLEKQALMKQAGLIGGSSEALKEVMIMFKNSPELKPVGRASFEKYLAERQPDAADGTGDADDGKAEPPASTPGDGKGGSPASATTTSGDALPLPTRQASSPRGRLTHLLPPPVKTASMMISQGYDADNWEPGGQPGDRDDGKLDLSEPRRPPGRRVMANRDSPSGLYSKG